jgi:pimeloyl-ACP methyl ester carboxylesterase
MPKNLILFFLFSFFHGIVAYSQHTVTSRFEWAKCPDCPLPKATPREMEQLKISTGYLWVPENRNDSASRMLRLGVVVFKAKNEKSGQSPVLFLHGGPGGRIVGDYSEKYEALQQYRDLIFIDQRGSGTSDAGFPTTMNQDILDVLAADLTNEKEEETRVNIARNVRSAISKKGINIASYNTKEIVKDIHDLCALLGYGKYSLWAGSYGTRGALVMMRDYPGDIDRVILESPLPPNAKYIQETTTNFKASLKKLFEKCKADPVGNKVYPNLEADFYSAIESLFKQPITIKIEDKNRFPSGKITINGQDMLLAIQQMMYDRTYFPLIPVLISALKERKEYTLKAIMQGMSRGIYRLNYGAYYSIICNDCMRYNDEHTFDSTSKDFFNGLTFYRDEFSICKVWNEYSSGKMDSAAVASNIPTLILSGEMDPISGNAYPVLIQKTLSNSHSYVFENTGHFASENSSAVNLIKKFLAGELGDALAVSFIKTNKIPFGSKLYMHKGVVDVSPKLAFNKNNTFYLTWLALCAIGLVISNIIAWKLLGKRGDSYSPGKQRIFAWASVIAGIVGIVFLVMFVMAIRQTAMENYMFLGFGLPAGKASILFLPYVTLGLYLLVFAFLPKSKVPGWHKSFLIRYFLLQLPFILFVAWFNLYYL